MFVNGERIGSPLLLEKKMKITATYQEKSLPRKYPYLGIHENDVDTVNPLIVVFTHANRGFMVHACPDSGVVDFNFETWDETEFLFYTGEVTLSN